MKTVRCAIYTRKSSEEGLEQDFNSLDAQREACAAYVLSQASEGWKLLPDTYDDGGLSGGTLERPALQRLLAEVKSGRIDIIVVYKVDRLTRSLLDFAKLVEALDQADTSFVSVTQSFNTTTSMGRLTLNMLLSFAQFEREVTAERIRDKIAASKAKGMWMGGVPPLGYAPNGRSLTIIQEHAVIVRDIYQRYRALGSVRLLADALASEGVVTPLRTTGSGREFGGRQMSRGQLYFILKNPIYAGDIPHKDQTYPGNHAPIIERSVWDAVQQQLEDNVQGARAERQRNASLLSDILFDEGGKPLIPVHTTKGTQRYRYYVSKAHHHCRATAPTPRPLRLRASEVDQLARREVCSFLADPLRALELVGVEATASMFDARSNRGAQVPGEVARLSDSAIRELLARVAVGTDHVELTLHSQKVCEHLGVRAKAPAAQVTIQSTAVLTRMGRTVRQVRDSATGIPARSPDQSIIRLILRARGWWQEIATGEWDVAALSQRDGVSDSYVSRVVRFAFLSPAVVDAAIAGTLRPELDAKALIATDAIGHRWKDQAAKLLSDPPI